MNTPPVDKRSIAILDKHLMFAQLLGQYIDKVLLDAEVVSVHTDSVAMLTDISKKSIDILILELSVNDRDSSELIRDFKAQSPDLKLIVLSAYRNQGLVKQAMLAGADAYIYKGRPLTEVITAYCEIKKGRVYLGDSVRVSPKPAASNSEVNYARDRFQLKMLLTNREREVLSHLAEGLDLRSVGEKLFISHSTVIVHKKNIMKKYKVKSLRNLIKIAVQESLV